MPSANLLSMNFTVDGRPPLEPNLLAASGRFRVEVVEELPSTNSAVVERFLAGAGAGLVLVAEHQTAGRGRLDRDWITVPRSALTLSILLTPDVEPPRWTWLPLLTGLAVARAVRETTKLTPTLKWPNDVLLGERKAGGILLERVDQGDRAAAVVGIGLNVHQTREELPVPEATSLALEGAPVDRGVLLEALLAAFATEYDAWAGGEDPRDRYRAECGTIGKEVVVHTITQDLRGEVVDIDETGCLVLSTVDGLRHLAVGDVEYVRPQESV